MGFISARGSIGWEPEPGAALRPGGAQPEHTSLLFATQLDAVTSALILTGQAPMLQHRHPSSTSLYLVTFESNKSGRVPIVPGTVTRRARRPERPIPGARGKSQRPILFRARSNSTPVSHPITIHLAPQPGCERRQLHPFSQGVSLIWLVGRGVWGSGPTMGAI